VLNRLVQLSCTDDLGPYILLRFDREVRSEEEVRISELRKCSFQNLYFRRSAMEDQEIEGLDLKLMNNNIRSISSRQEGSLDFLHNLLCLKKSMIFEQI
jgi:hypothetical protein